MYRDRENTRDRRRERSAYRERDEATRRDGSSRATVSDTCSRMVRRPTPVARLPIAHVICTYQYEPCQIYHSARYTRTRFRARSPPRCGLYSISRFPPVCRRRARHKQARRCKRGVLSSHVSSYYDPGRNSAATTSRQGRFGGGSPCPLSDYTRTWSFQQVRSMLARVCAMFDITRCSALTITRRTEREAGSVGRRIISRIDTADRYTSCSLRKCASVNSRQFSRILNL